jgi:hypothetical protein
MWKITSATSGEAGHPVSGDPVEAHADMRQESRRHQREHGECGEPVEQPIDAGVALNPLGPKAGRAAVMAEELMFVTSVSASATEPRTALRRS